MSLHIGTFRLYDRVFRSTAAGLQAGYVVVLLLPNLAIIEWSNN